MLLRSVCFSFVVAFIASLSLGDEPLEKPLNKPLISTPVRLVLQDQFERDALGPNWVPRPNNDGRFYLSQGTLTGETTDKELAQGAVTAILAQPCRNLGMSFKIKLGDARGAGIGIGGKPAGETGFVTAIRFFNEKGAIQVEADTQTLVMAKQELDGEKWYQVMVEVVGNRVVVQLDGEKILDGENPSISKFPKKSISFFVYKGKASIDDIAAGEIVPQ
jgi:hypothetical protein